MLGLLLRVWGLGFRVNQGIWIYVGFHRGEYVGVIYLGLGVRV